jgi:hypothetical protein
MPVELRRYRLAGRVVASTILLPELAGAEDDPADWTVGQAEAQPSRSGRWFHRWLDARGREVLSFGRCGSEYVLRFVGLGSFRVAPDRRLVTCAPGRRMPDMTLRHLLLNQVLPLAFGAERLVLHASAVTLAGGAVAFAGPGGAGKSTLAAALASRGHPLVSDDFVAVTETATGSEIDPSYPSVRLWGDALGAVLGSCVAPRVAHYTRKRRVPVHGLLPLADRPVPLRASCLIEGDRDGHGTSAERLTPRDALVRLMPLAFQLDVADAGCVQTVTEAVARAAEQLPVYALRYPRKFSRLPQVVSDLERLLLPGPPPTAE